MKLNLFKIHLMGSGDTPGPGPSPSLNNCIKFSTLGEAHIGIKYLAPGSNIPFAIIETSNDGKEWGVWDGSAKTVTSRTPLYVRGKGAWSSNTNARMFYTDINDSEIMVEGNIMSLLDYENIQTELPEYAFSHMFYNVVNLVDASNLVLPDSISNHCYYMIFESCSSLKYAPELPSKTLAPYCYSRMFYGCSSLLESPVLMANTNKSGTTLYYERMFYNCTSLRQLTAYHTFMNTTSTGPTYYWVYGVPTTCKVKKSPFAVTTKNASIWPSTTSYQTNGSKSFIMEPATIDRNVTEYKIISSVDGPWQVNDWNTNKAFEYPADIYYGPGEVIITLAHPEYLEDWSANKFGLYEYYSTNVYSSSIVNPYYVPTQFTFGQNIVEEGGVYKVDNPIYNEPITIGIEATREFTSMPVLNKIDEGLYEFTPTTFLGDITLTVTATGEKKTIKYVSHYIDISVDDDRAEKDTQGNLSANLNTGDVVENWYVDANKSYTVQMTQEGSSATIEQGIKDGVYNITAVSAGTTVFSFSDGYVTKTITVNVASEPEPEPTEVKNCIKFSSVGTSTVGYTASGNVPENNIECSTDLVNWTSWGGAEQTVTVDQPLYVRGKGHWSSANSVYRSFTMTGDNVTVSGNVMNMVDYENPDIATMAGGEFTKMFINCSSLVNAPELPATKLSSYCYSYMFWGCTALTTAPELPATTLADNCYDSMFAKCTSLVNAPELPATKLSSYCYSYMFNGCTSLVNAPELPATTLKSFCYQYMFYNCGNLALAPELPATTLAGYCYQYMFNGCTNLVNAPELPATTLTNYCYKNMFANCTNLKHVTMPANDVSATGALTDWLKGAGTKASNPTLYVDPSMVDNGTITTKKGVFTIAPIAA